MSTTESPHAPSRIRPRAASASLCAAALVLLGASCSSGGDDRVDSVATTTTTQVPAASADRPTELSTEGSTATSIAPTSAPPSTNDASSELEVIERYVGYWDARFAANTGVPNPNHPGLSEYATGAQLDAVTAETQGNLEAGRSFEPRPEPANVRDVTIISIGDGEAIVQECFVDDGLVMATATGEVINDTIATHSVRGVLHIVDGSWRVTSTSLVQRWEGVAGCALAS